MKDEQEIVREYINEIMEKTAIKEDGLVEYFEKKDAESKKQDRKSNWLQIIAILVSIAAIVVPILFGA